MPGKNNERAPGEAHSGSEHNVSSAVVWRTFARCDAEARKGTGTGLCAAGLDEHGACPRADRHA